jgi:type VI protein secretion system component VasK
MIAYNYPLLDFFWTMLLIFLFFMWIWLLVVIFTDIFRSPDLHGLGKAMWFLLVLFVPLIGVLAYLIVRGHKMQEHAAKAAEQQDEALRQYVREASGDGADGSTTDQLVKLAELRDRGAITPQEFEQQKTKLLA